MWVEGEVSNLTIALLRPLVLLAEGRQRAGARGGLEDGDAAHQVQAEGRDEGPGPRRRSASIRPRASTRSSVEVLEPLGKGSLQQAFEDLKEKLEKEGLFDRPASGRCPMLPRRVGIVTSPTGAVIQDILRVVGRRYANLEIAIYPARVQGRGGGGGDHPRHPRPERGRRLRRADRGPRRRQPRGPLALQRRAGGARAGRVEDPDHLRGRPRDRLHHRRLRGRPARAHALGGGGARGRRPRTRSARASTALRRRADSGARPAPDARAVARGRGHPAPRVRGRARPPPQPRAARGRPRCAGRRPALRPPRRARARVARAAAQAQLEAFRWDRQIADAARAGRATSIAGCDGAGARPRRGAGGPPSAARRASSTASRRWPCCPAATPSSSTTRGRLLRRSADAEVGADVRVRLGRGRG